MKEIIWIADYSDKTHPGGAQITNRAMINYGSNLGFKIKEFYLDDFQREETLEKTILNMDGLFILNNIVHLYYGFAFMMARIVNSKPFVRYEHDYMWFHKLISNYKILEVYKRAMGKIFLSPLHFEEHKKFGVDTTHSIIICSPVNTAVFQPLTHVKRAKNTAIYAGGIGWHKGIDHIVAYAKEHPEILFDLYGWIEQRKWIENLPENVKHHNPFAVYEAVSTYNKYQYAIHLPTWKEPFGRFLAEAYLCDCKLITNKNSGFHSFGWDLDNKDFVKKQFDESPKIFWQYLHSILEKL